MSEYISKQAAKAVVVHTIKAVRLAGHTGVVGMMFDEIESLQPVDVAPVVHAEWIDHTDDEREGYWECSSCGNPWLLMEGTPAENKMNYCPNCGAKMIKED